MMYSDEFKSFQEKFIDCQNNIQHSIIEKKDIIIEMINSNIYPCYNKKCNLCVQPTDNKLIYAIHYLQDDIVQNILNNMTEQEIFNYKSNLCNINNINFTYNILDYIYNNLLSSTRSILYKNNIPNLDFITYSSFTNIYSNKFDVDMCNKLLNIINCICTKCPKLITHKIINTIYKLRCLPILKILVNYYKIDDLCDKICFICLSDYNDNLIKMTCNCNMFIHLECLIELINKNGSLCKTCNSDTHAVISKINHIIFPKHNIYRQPLVNIYKIIDKNDKIESLRYAIIYLQIDEVKNILNNMTNEEYKYYKKNIDYYGLHKINKISGNLELADTLFSNITRKQYPNDFKLIEDALYIKDKL